jgi:hypothetical protein
MLRYYALAVFLFIGQVAFSLDIKTEPVQFLSRASTWAVQRFPQAKLYSIESVASSDKLCPEAGWQFSYYAKVSRDEDVSESARVLVIFRQESSKGSCAWNQSREVSYNKTPVWGTSPLEAALLRRHITVRDALAVVKGNFRDAFELSSIFLSRPALQEGPTFTYLVFGKVCNQLTHLTINGEDGSIFSAPERPDCPAPRP